MTWEQQDTLSKNVQAETTSTEREAVKAGLVTALQAWNSNSSSEGEVALLASVEMAVQKAELVGIPEDVVARMVEDHRWADSNPRASAWKNLLMNLRQLVQCVSEGGYLDHFQNVLGAITEAQGADISQNEINTLVEQYQQMARDQGQIKLLLEKYRSKSSKSLKSSKPSISSKSSSGGAETVQSASADDGESGLEVELSVLSLAGDMLASVSAQPLWTGAMLRAVIHQKAHLQPGTVITGLICEGREFLPSQTVQEVHLASGMCLYAIMGETSDKNQILAHAELASSLRHIQDRYHTSRSASDVQQTSDGYIEVHNGDYHQFITNLRDDLMSAIEKARGAGLANVELRDAINYKDLLDKHCRIIPVKIHPSQVTYVPPATTYAPPVTYVPPATTYAAPTTSYAAPTTSYAAPTMLYVAPTTSSAAPTMYGGYGGAIGGYGGRSFDYGIPNGD